MPVEHGALLNSTVGEALKAVEDPITQTAKPAATQPAATTTAPPPPADASDEPVEEIEDLGTITLTDSEPEAGVVTLEG